MISLGESGEQNSAGMYVGEKDRNIFADYSRKAILKA